MRWRIRRPGQVLGPYTDEKLRELAAEGLVVPTDEIFPDGETGDVVFRASDVVRSFGNPPQSVPHAAATQAARPAVVVPVESGTPALVQAIVLSMSLVLVPAYFLVADMNVADMAFAVGMALLAASEPVRYVERRFGRKKDVMVSSFAYWIILAVLAMVAFWSETSQYEDGITSNRFARSLGAVSVKVLVSAAVAYVIGMVVKWRLEFAYSERKK
jgi:hypothetical protein